MREGVKFVALIGLILSLLVHLLALIGANIVATFPLVWFLHLGIFLVIIPLIFFEQKSLKTQSKFALSKSMLPRSIEVSRKVLSVYLIVSFGVCIFLSDGGIPDIRDGKYILHNHGKLIRELTQNEYKTFLMNEMRFFSTFWIFFYFESFVRLQFWKVEKYFIKNT